MAIIHETCEGMVRAERDGEVRLRAYRFLADRNRAVSAFRRFGWTVTAIDLPPCRCGLPNRAHFYKDYPESFGGRDRQY